jgi:hypothetical protein
MFIVHPLASAFPRLSPFPKLWKNMIIIASLGEWEGGWWWGFRSVSKKSQRGVKIRTKKKCIL